MSGISEYIQSQTSDQNLRSHLFGILKRKQFLECEKDKQLSGIDVSNLWDLYTTYTKKVCHAERLHAGRTIKLSQWVKSVIESYTR
jgi:hypothetical protein